ncbi:hypothetical protein QBC39DRAFT_403289 [Podospora conica]|nr:hypothetical protein QBC39DRAFT_403289 [Schizothecium conicum]
MFFGLFFAFFCALMPPWLASARRLSPDSTRRATLDQKPGEHGGAPMGQPCLTLWLRHQHSLTSRTTSHQHIRIRRHPISTQHAALHPTSTLSPPLAELRDIVFLTSVGRIQILDRYESPVAPGPVAVWSKSWVDAVSPPTSHLAADESRKAQPLLSTPSLPLSRDSKGGHGPDPPPRPRLGPFAAAGLHGRRDSTRVAAEHLGDIPYTPSASGCFCGMDAGLLFGTQPPGFTLTTTNQTPAHLERDRRYPPSSRWSSASSRLVPSGWAALGSAAAMCVCRFASGA